MKYESDDDQNGIDDIHENGYHDSGDDDGSVACNVDK